MARNFANVNILEINRAVVSLQFDWSSREDRLAAVPIILQDNIVSDELFVKVDRNFIAGHHNAETIPFSNRLVGELRRPRRAFLIIV
jgi:hypothetical protein